MTLIELNCNLKTKIHEYTLDSIAVSNQRKFS